MSPLECKGLTYLSGKQCNYIYFYCRYQADLNAILELTTTILKHMNLQKNILNNVCALLATPVQDLEDQVGLTFLFIILLIIMLTLAAF